MDQGNDNFLLGTAVHKAHQLGLKHYDSTMARFNESLLEREQLYEFFNEVVSSRVIDEYIVAEDKRSFLSKPITEFIAPKHIEFILNVLELAELFSTDNKISLLLFAIKKAKPQNITLYHLFAAVFIALCLTSSESHSTPNDDDSNEIICTDTDNLQEELKKTEEIIKYFLDSEFIQEL